MIDIWGVIANSLWILGLAVLLAALSWARWIAHTEQSRLRVVLKRPRTQQILDAGLFLFCAGLAATGRAWWECILWGLLAAAWVVQAWLAWANARKQNPSDANG
ncbi:MAG: hypothetical protein JXA14_16975 [Anaerolineae bacterium]|nr:hypothetical protein [Anaerolineae bacterium]